MPQGNTLSIIQRRFAMSILTLSIFLAASFSYAEEPGLRRFDIAAQSLSSALNEFARQSHQQILFAPGIVAQKLSSPVRGDLLPTAALRVLLKDSGLTFSTTPNGAILVGNADTRYAVSDGAAKPEAARQPAASTSAADLATVTVEGAREKEILRRQVRNYALGITRSSFGVTIARWEKPTPVCPLIAGLSHDDGEYTLRRLSRIATAAGVPLAPERCKPNFYVVVTSEPNELLKAWSERDPWMFDDDADEGGTVINGFLKASTPVRAWYNIAYTISDDILPRLHLRGRGGVRHSGLRDLSSVILVVDAGLAKGINFGQLAAYLAMAGFAQIRLDATLGDAPSILQVFSNREKAPPEDLSAWDKAYLKALYETQHSDKTQRLAIARSMIREISP
jgi:hypothetical protein